MIAKQVETNTLKAYIEIRRNKLLIQTEAESQKLYTKWKMLDTKGCIEYNSIYMTFWETEL